jgi:type VI secretion system secreted protein VgrG
MLGAPMQSTHPASPRTATLESDDFAASDLLVTRVEGHEAINEPYRYDVWLRPRDRTATTPVDTFAMIGAGARVVLSNAAGDAVRAIAGIVRTARADVDGAARASKPSARPTISYHLTIEPLLVRLADVTTQEIFMNQTVPEIIADKIGRMDEGYAVFRTKATYPEREFVVQYKETDLDFVKRLAEHVGLAFHFEHGEQGEHVVFSDHPEALPSRRDEPLSFGPREEGHAVHALAVRAKSIPAVYGVHDYNYRNPRLDIGAIHEIEDGAGGLVEYGTHHKTPEEGEAIAKVRAEEHLARQRVLEGATVVGWLEAGARVRLEHDPFGDEGDLVISRVTHVFEQTHFDEAKEATGHAGSFEAVSAARPFRPPRVTPRPRIHGVLSAVVKADPTQPGPRAHEPVIDDQGRYLVEFHFDTQKREGERSSRLVRMAQPFAGPGQGMHFPLLPDTEVLVAFVDGDPDRPIIVGAIPNPVTPNHVTAEDAHMHRIRSRHGLVVEFGKTVKR